MAPPPPNPPDPPVPSWLRSLPRAPEYRPTESEFADPIAFLSRVEREAAAFGICKVIPPYPRPSRRFVFAHFNRSLSSSDSPSPPSSPSSSSSSSSSVFTTRHQELGTPRRPRPPQVLKQVWQSGEHYTLEQFEAKSRAFSRTHLAGLREPSPLAVESLFWKAAADRPIYIEYANDVPGSGFAAPVRPRRKKRKREGVPLEEGEKGAGWRLSNSPWNLQAIARAPGSLTRFMPDDVPGVTSPMVYIGMLFSWFAWHVEDHELHSLNFLHTGMPKTWYAVPGDRAAELEEVIRVHGYGGDSDRLASLAVLGEKTTLMSPEVLVACGVPCCRLVQYPGEFVVTFPRAYHVGFSHGFNCGEAANFATPQWLKFAKDAAVRRAVMNYLPMLSHQQLLYLLAVSFISRTPRELLSGIRNSRLRDRRKEERELLVKKEFLQDMLSENELLCCFLEKKSIVNAVLWEPDLLPSPIVLNSCTSGSKVPERKSDDGCRTANIQCNLKDNCLSDDTACAIGTDCKYISTDSKSSNSRSVSEEAKIDDIDADEDDLPFDLSIDSGSLTCVACGILGYPFMAILQPSRKGLEEISLVDGEKCSLSSEKEKCSDEHPFSIKDDNSGYPCIANRSSCNHAELPCLVTVTEEQANFDHQNEEASKDAKADKDKFCLMQQELDQSCHQRCNSSHSCSSENTLHSCSEEDATNINLSRSGSLGSELSKQAGRDIDRQAIECCHNGINWNTSSVFARPRIFCLRHALEIEELLQGKGGAHVLVICHTDYLKLKALAISIAEEIEFQFDCKDIPLANASKSDLHIINTSIDDEGHEEDGRDWTSRLGLNLKYGVKLRKDAPGNQEQPSLFFRGLFSDPSPISIVPNLKWLCRKARTPYKVVGYASPRSPVAAIPEKVKPAVMRTDIGTVGNVYESRKRQHTLELVGLLQQTGTGEPDGMTDIDMHCEENDYDGDYLVDIPIALAEYPLMHQVCEGTITVGTCNESICSLNLQDSPPLTTVSVEFTREQGRAQRTELGSSATVSVEQFPGNLNESICKGSSMNFVSNHKNLESQDDSLGYKDEQLQVQQETHENMELCNNPKKELDAALSEETHENTASAALENEGDGAKVSYCSDIILRTNKSAGADEPSYCSDILRTGKSARADEPETHDLVASPVTSELQSNCDEMTSRVGAQHRLTMGCLATTDSPCSSKLLFIANDLMGNGLQAIYNLEKHKDFTSAVRVDVSQSIVESTELKSNDGKKLPSRSPNRDIINSKDAQAALSSSIPEQDGQLAKGSNFDILLGVLSQESKIADASKNDEVRKASSTLMTLTINDHSADVTQAEVAETAGSGGVSISDKAQSCSTLATDKLMVIQNHDIQQKQFANAEEIDTRNSEDFKDDVGILGGSANCVTTTCCLAKTSRSWVAAHEDQYIDGPNDLHMSDVVSRSIGNSKRTDILCYVRRKGKRKREQELKTGSSQICGSFVRGPCESLRPRTRPTIVEDITKKTTHADNSAANRGKTMKAGPFKCDIDFCNMTFQTKAELHAHKRNICIVESCGKRFSSHKYLKRHQCVHSDERPFKCPWDGCQMTFKWLWAQTEHVRVHTGERPYRCLAPGCGQRFRYVSDFSRHRKKFNHYMD